MPRKTGKLQLHEGDFEYLSSFIKQRTIQAQIVIRAHILLDRANGISIRDIASIYDLSTNTVRMCMDKYISGGTDRALFDDQRKRRPVEITDDAKSWILNVACQKPVELGYSAELWTLSALHKHICKNAETAGYPRLATVTKPYLQKLLKTSDIKPFKIKYYLEKREPDFEQKMHDVLVVYKQVSLQFDEEGNIIIPADGIKKVTLSYDEKPGIQAIGNTCPDLKPTLEHGFVSRDSEYVRHGTLSLLAAIDLLTGEAIPLVSETHKSSDFVAFLKKLDSHYPKQDRIRIILDNHSAHTSKETRNFLATMSEGRFEFVFTPKHGSWLNMIESFFGKFTKQMLRGICVNSKEELKERIYQYFEEINQEPVIYLGLINLMKFWIPKLQTVNVSVIKYSMY